MQTNRLRGFRYMTFLSCSSFMQRIRLDATSPLLLTLCVGALSLLHSAKWTAIATGIMEGIWNVTLCKVALGISVLLFSIAALLQLAGFQNRMVRFVVRALRWAFDSTASITVTTASVLIGVVAALLIFVMGQEPHAWRLLMQGGWILYLAALIVGMMWCGSYYLHHADVLVTDRRKALTISLLVGFLLVLSVWYLFFEETFCELPALHHAATACRPQAATGP